MEFNELFKDAVVKRATCILTDRLIAGTLSRTDTVASVLDVEGAIAQAIAQAIADVTAEVLLAASAQEQRIAGAWAQQRGGVKS